MYPYPGLTIHYGDTHTQAGLYIMVKLHTLARPYTMVTRYMGSKAGMVVFCVIASAGPAFWVFVAFDMAVCPAVHALFDWFCVLVVGEGC